ncbi:PAS domain-containing protein [Mariniphaga anaerophila]|uniref:PAS domain-containing protein n=1 Tax=Mariniphaga anaerophila TaxID=1484053 RepID=A0A1M4VHM6_9BACT|nr:PAS domain-containing protein [Mariniphaga anaerophila]SHE68448.1 PAS domain-containing protein [Mariniphaga anaerophila]
MKLEFQRIEEANDLVNQLIEHHPQAIFLTDQNFKVKYFNDAFRKLSESDKGDVLEHEFCEIFGCTQRGKKIDAKDSFCARCRIRELLSGSNLSELELVRDFYINNRMETKHLHFDAHRVVMQGLKYRLVVVDDRTQKR